MQVISRERCNLTSAVPTMLIAILQHPDFASYDLSSLTAVLVSMRERAEELGGTRTIEPVPSGGTPILARLPYVRSERADVAVGLTLKTVRNHVSNIFKISRAPTPLPDQ